VVRDENGAALVDSEDPFRYETKFLENAAGGNVLPSLGIVVEF